MLSVGDASTTSKERSDSSPEAVAASGEESSMEVEYQRNKSPLLNAVPNLEMIEQPEEVRLPSGVELGAQRGSAPLVMSVCNYERTLLYSSSIVLSI